MVELKAVSACEGMLPLVIGAVRVEEMDLGPLTSLSPFGDALAFEGALQDTHGLAVPKPNRSTGKDGARCIWFGRSEVVLVGTAPNGALGKHAAVVDVSDGWAAVTVQGVDAVDVLARLVPVDLREAHFKRGHSARTQIGHVATSITRIGADKLLILVFRSMAGTLIAELRHAMEGVAARR